MQNCNKTNLELLGNGCCFVLNRKEDLKTQKFEFESRHSRMFKLGR